MRSTEPDTVSPAIASRGVHPVIFLKREIISAVFLLERPFFAEIGIQWKSIESCHPSGNEPQFKGEYFQTPRIKTMTWSVTVFVPANTTKLPNSTGSSYLIMDDRNMLWKFQPQPWWWPGWSITSVGATVLNCKMSGPGCDPNCRDPQVTGGLLVTDFYREKHGVPMSSHIFYSWFQFPGQMGFLLANSIWHIVNVRILLCCFFLFSLR